MKRILLIGVIAFTLIAGAAAQTDGYTFGLGHSTVFRVGPGKDSSGVQVYSFTYVYGTAIFDKTGKIVDLEIDELEVSTPNYDGHSMPHFPGWPGTPGYNVVDHKTEKLAGVTNNTVEYVAGEVQAWKTKRDRADDYGMNAQKDWWKQMDGWESFFIGKTISEVETWYKKYTNDKNGRPLNPETKDAAEKAKYEALSSADKAVVADVRSGATMSINDPHGYVLIALRNAWDNRKPMGK